MARVEERWVAPAPEGGGGAAMLRYGAVANATESAGAERVAVAGVELELVRRGVGRPVLLLHGAQTVDPQARFLELLGRHAEIIAPSHPGFGRSARPAGFETVYDLVHFYLDVLEALPHEKVTLIGLSFGGWLAAEVAVTCGHRLDKLVLVDAFGRDGRDRSTHPILDALNTPAPVGPPPRSHAAARRAADPRALC